VWVALLTGRLPVGSRTAKIDIVDASLALLLRRPQQKVAATMQEVKEGTVAASAQAVLHFASQQIDRYHTDAPQKTQINLWRRGLR
jgi:hypothetical protein